MSETKRLNKRNTREAKSSRPPFGYNGKVLRVNLSNKSITTEIISEEFCRRYIGGAGFIAYYLWKELKQGVDALGPDNKLIFALGPLSGLNLPGAARHCIGAKSPLTGGIAKGEAGGFWAAELKRAGYDAIIIEGKANKPVYLWIQNGGVILKDAVYLWGKEIKETEAAIRTELGDDRIQLALIGPAGENMVRYASIMHGLFDAAGRGGLGAVMGSKNLKAIAVRGNKLPKLANSDRVKEIRQQTLAKPLPMQAVFGTGGPEMLGGEAMGDLPVRNFRDGKFPEVNQIHGGIIKESISIGMRGCFACPVRCKKVVQFDGQYRVDADYGGPEYETLAALGSNCGIGNLKAICKGSERCNAHSLDSISTGGVIAFAMECFEKGLLTTKDTGGIQLRFGNEEAMLQVIELIAKRQGIGNLLAEGTARMSQKIGRGSEKFAMHVKGLEAGMHEPRCQGGFALGYMVSPGGADHTTSFMEIFFAIDEFLEPWRPFGILETIPMEDIDPYKVGVFKLYDCSRALSDSVCLCVFLMYSIETHTELIKAVTGWDTGVVELLRVGERVQTIMRLFNVREGFTDADDELPERYYQPTTDGILATKPLATDRTKLEQAKRFYYTLMGWDIKGIPLPEKVAELNIE